MQLNGTYPTVVSNYNMAATKTCEALAITITTSKSNRNALPVQAYYRPRGLQDVVAPRISRQSANECGKIVSKTQRLNRSQGHSAAGRIMSIKNSSHTIGKRTRDLSVCSAVPQLIAPPSGSLCSLSNKLNSILHKANTRLYVSLILMF
jgi:hypothetical protein